MNINFKRAAAMTALVVGLAALVTAPVQAETFNPTNQLVSAQGCVSFPTNTVGTNGFGALTGGKISVANYERCGFYFSGYCSAITGTGNAVLKLIASASDGPPSCDTTNRWWDTNNVLTLSVPITGVGPVYWVTNVPPEFVRPANWLGVFSSTNSSVGCTMTNVDYGLNKKVLPVHLQ